MQMMATHVPAGQSQRCQELFRKTGRNNLKWVRRVGETPQQTLPPMLSRVLELLWISHARFFLVMNTMDIFLRNTMNLIRSLIVTTASCISPRTEIPRPPGITTVFFLWILISSNHLHLASLIGHICQNCSLQESSNLYFWRGKTDKFAGVVPALPCFTLG